MKVNEARRSRLGLLTALVAGLINGLLGTGGGMVMVLALGRLYPGEEKRVLAISTACVFVFSILSIILYTISGRMREVRLLPTILPSLLGGLLGALLLGRLRGEAVEGLFACLLILAGARLLF